MTDALDTAFAEVQHLPCPAGMMTKQPRKERMQGQAAVKVGIACVARAALTMGSIAQQMVKPDVGTTQTKDRSLQIGAKTITTCELHCKSKKSMF